MRPQHYAFHSFLLATLQMFTIVCACMGEIHTDITCGVYSRLLGAVITVYIFFLPVSHLANMSECL